MPSSFALGAHFETFVKEQVQSGRYNNASEVLRAGLRLLEDQEQRRRAAWAEFERLVDEGLADIEAGRTYPAEEVFAELRERYSKMAESKSK
ncbi:MAG TPA: type II toxin-antitoxin system ParD family antitoxin [Hyphomicrobiales bacterium]|nr:type II toxin-antitoxin system ParD family antitoxin [Hyphomicrobiales bacterium]